MSDPLRVLISAGASGIGSAVARRFRADGALVSVCDCDDVAMSALVTADPEIHGVVVDVTDADGLAGWVDGVVERWGGVDVLVNNAGVAGPTALVEDIDPAAWRECIAVNIDSHFMLTRLVVPPMKAQRGGVIVNISSTAGLYGYGMRSPYATSKWAVIGFTKSLAIELGPFGVRVNAIAPGSVEGDRMGRVIEAEARARGVSAADVEREYTQGQSIARFVRPSEIADVCAFLASPAASMINGQVIAVDGNTETYHLASGSATSTTSATSTISGTAVTSKQPNGARATPAHAGLPDPPLE
jgi:NAD(P)-dependent dehydrogenase (short-subunit alcohol dehydrogenase family)